MQKSQSRPKKKTHIPTSPVAAGGTSSQTRKSFWHLLLQDRSSGKHLLGGLALVLLEVLVEQLAQLVDLVLEAGGGDPAPLGVEQLAGNTGAALGDVQVEDLVGFVLNIGELTAVNGIEDGTSVLQWATLTASGGASANPAGVEQPGVSLVFGDLVGQHAGVAHGVQSQEGLSEARREGSLGLRNTILSTSHLGGVSGDEVEHGLLSGELGDRGEDTTGVAGKQDDVGGVLLADAGDEGVVDVLNGVGAAGVLGEGGIVVVDNTGGRVEDNVLQDGSEADGVENVGLLLSGQTNALGVAATLDVEDTLVGPAVLVITDQSTLGVGRQRRLTSSGQTEEDGDVAIGALVGGGVQGQDVVLDGHLVEEDGEDTLLHFTGILGTQDDHLLLGKVDSNGGGRGHTLGEAVSREGTGVVDDIVRVEVLELLLGRTDEHVAHEQGMVGTGADNADVDTVSLIPASKAVNNVDTVPGVEVVDCTLAVDAPDLEETLATDDITPRDPVRECGEPEGWPRQRGRGVAQRKSGPRNKWKCLQMRKRGFAEQNHLRPSCPFLAAFL